MTIKKSEIVVSLGQLLLDPNNYRLNTGEDPIDYSPEEIKALQSETLKKLVSKNLSELEGSIRLNGFLEVDKIVVKRLPDDDETPKYVVVEGNRRTAAFKSLMLNSFDRSTDSYQTSFSQELIDKAENINVILIKGSEKEIEDYARRLMGVRHVSGPKPWGAYQSARLIYDMVSSGKSNKEVGELLGMRPKEIDKKFNAFCAFHQMKRDEKYGAYADTSLFSLFVDALASSSYFRDEWLQWNEKEHVFENTAALERYFESIVSKDGSNPEISNPTLFREFRKSIEIDEVRSQIMRGIRYRDVDYDFDKDKRIKRIDDFIKFLSHKSFSPDEVLLLRDLSHVLDCMLSEEDGD